MASLQAPDEGVRTMFSWGYEKRPRLNVRVNAIEPESGIRALDD